MEYKITNVLMVSDFKTSTIEGEDISPKFNNDSQRNYFQAGFGNYSKFLADGNILYEINKDTRSWRRCSRTFNQRFEKDFPWSSKQSDFNVALFINSTAETGKFNITADLGNHNYNYYGIYAFNQLLILI